MMSAIDWASLTDDQVNDELDAGLAERKKRMAAISAQQTIIQAQMDYLAARDGTTSMPEWVQPTGAMDAYPTDYVVTHGGKTWVALADNNVWEPGVAGWREQTADGAPAEWAQPSGATDVYPLGAVVTHNSKTWTSTADNNVWEPGVYGWAAS